MTTKRLVLLSIALVCASFIAAAQFQPKWDYMGLGKTANAQLKDGDTSSLLVRNNDELIIQVCRCPQDQKCECQTKFKNLNPDAPKKRSRWWTATAEEVQERKHSRQSLKGTESTTGEELVELKGFTDHISKLKPNFREFFTDLGEATP